MGITGIKLLIKISLCYSKKHQKDQCESLAQWQVFSIFQSKNKTKISIKIETNTKFLYTFYLDKNPFNKKKKAS